MKGLLIFIVFISLACNVIQAEAKLTAITMPVFTKHFPKSSPDLNEHNRGFGIEYALQKDVTLTTGLFNNSLSKDTFYLGVQYTPFRILGLHTGVVLGLDLSGGYNSVNPVKPFIGAVHFAAGNKSSIGYNIDILPGVWGRYGVCGAAAVSMKYSF